MTARVAGVARCTPSCPSPASEESLLGKRVLYDNTRKTRNRFARRKRGRLREQADSARRRARLNATHQKGTSSANWVS